MTDRETAKLTGARPRVRRSIWLTVLAGVIAVLVLEMAFPQRLLTTPVPDTVDMADMTWVEVRSAVEHGYTVAIVPSGGIEQNGPHMVLGKHDYIVHKTANRIARELGHALVTPVVSYVPEGDYDPPSGNMLYPGTLGVPEPVFAQVLEGIARSLNRAGFKTICFIGDHGGNQAAQAQVAAKLTREWAGQVIVLHVSDYYDVGDPQTKFLRNKGEPESALGDHAGLIDTSELMATHPEGVDLARLNNLPLRSEPTGYSGDPTHSLATYGAALLDIKVAAAVRQIRAVLAGRNASTEPSQKATMIAPAATPVRR
jgi:creatinine amidohydrolase